MMKTIIITNKIKLINYLKEIWLFRELAIRLAIRQLAITYKQTYLGMIWIILQPLIMLIIFMFLLKRMVDIEELAMPYSVFATIGLVTWNFFAALIRDITGSLVYSAGMVTKIYFPRILLSISFILSRGIDFLVSILVLIFVMILSGFMPSSNIIYTPIFLFLMLISAFGLGILFSALAVSYRDFIQIIPVAIQIGFFLSPVFYYSKTLVPEHLYTIYTLNPVVLAIEGIRWSMTTGPFPLTAIQVALASSVAIFSLFIGFYVFMRYEKVLADII